MLTASTARRTAAGRHAMALPLPDLAPALSVAPGDASATAAPGCCSAPEAPVGAEGGDDASATAWCSDGAAAPPSELLVRAVVV